MQHIKTEITLTLMVDILYGEKCVTWTLLRPIYMQSRAPRIV